MPATRSRDSARSKPVAKRAARKPPKQERARHASRSTAAAQQPVAHLPVDAERWKMIAVAAYYLAEHRGFAPGDQLDNWLRAEAEINRNYPL